jgi:pimeloyl-ACP methyl ester carboxylesterase
LDGIMSRLIELAHARGSQHVAVVFVHGLGGDWLGTWTIGTGVDAVWPKWLAEDLEGVAVWSVDYEAPLSDWRGSAMELTDRAANVLNLLLVQPDLGEGQLILVGHSLGGLVIKHVLRKAADLATERADAHSFIERVRKVIFLATPHVAADLPGWGDLLRIFVRPSAATRSLLRNDPHLRDLNLWYRRWAKQHGVDHLILTETKATFLFGMVVKPDSSDPGLASDPIPIDTDHIEIAKPANRQSLVYQLVAISSCVKPCGRSRMRKERSMQSRTTHRRSARMSNC